MGNVMASSAPSPPFMSSIPSPPITSDSNEQNSSNNENDTNPGSMEDLHRKCKGLHSFHSLLPLIDSRITQSFDFTFQTYFRMFSTAQK